MNKVGGNREGNARAMRRAIAAGMRGVAGAVLAMLVMLGVTGMVVLLRRGLLLLRGADADRHRPDGARGNQRDQEQDNRDFKAAKHRAIMTWAGWSGSLA